MPIKIPYIDNASQSDAKGKGATTLSGAVTVTVEEVTNGTDGSLEWELTSTLARPSTKPSGVPSSFNPRTRITEWVKDQLYGGEGVPKRFFAGGKVHSLSGGEADKIILRPEADATLLKPGDVIVWEKSTFAVGDVRAAVVDYIKNDSNLVVTTTTNLTGIAAGDYIQKYHMYADAKFTSRETLQSFGGIKSMLEMPFPPTSFNVSVRNTTTVRCTWTRPACSNASCYHVYYGQGLNNPNFLGNMTPASGSGTNVTGAVIGGLTAGKKYTFCCVARNSNATNGFKESPISSYVTVTMA